MCLYRQTSWQCGHLREHRILDPCEPARRGRACAEPVEEPAETWPEQCPTCTVQAMAARAAVATFKTGAGRDRALQAALAVIDGQYSGPDPILDEIAAMDLRESFIETWETTAGPRQQQRTDAAGGGSH